MRPHLGALMLALLLGSPAAAQPYPGINLSWNDCGASGDELEFFACETNAGSSTLYVSVVPDQALPQLIGTEIVIDLETDAAELPDWWKLQTGCRIGAITVIVDFTSGPFTCADPWQGAAISAINYQVGFVSPNRARLRAAAGVNPSVSAAAGTEYYLFAFRINHENAANPSCSGCRDKVCMVLSSLRLAQPPGFESYTYSIASHRDYASWRCPAFRYSKGELCGFNCTVPARSPTWGAVKGLYR